MGKWHPFQLNLSKHNISLRNENVEFWLEQKKSDRYKILQRLTLHSRLSIRIKLFQS